MSDYTSHQPEQTAPIQVLTSLSPFQPSTFSLTEKFQYCMPFPYDSLSGSGTVTKLCSDEQKLVRDAVTAKFLELLQSHGGEVFAGANGKGFLIRGLGHGWKASSKKSYGAVICIYTGLGRPYCADAGKYQRVFLKEEGAAQRSWRWVKVEVVDCDHAAGRELVSWERPEGFYEGVEEGKREAWRRETSVLYLRYHLKTEPMSLVELVEGASTASNVEVASQLRGVVDALIAAEDFAVLDGSLDPKTQVYHGHKFFDLNQTTEDVLGLKYCQGISRTLRVSAQQSSEEPVALNTQMCFKLFYPSTSVAEFVRNFFGAGPYSESAHKDINRCLVGLNVQFKGPTGQTLQRRVYSLSSSKPYEVPEELKHASWQTKGDSLRQSLQYPDVPCIHLGRNVGILPSELCAFVPMQPFNHAVGRDLSRKLQTIREAAHLQPVEQKGRAEPVIEHVVAQKPAEKLEMQQAQDLLKRSFGGSNPAVLFIEASVEKGFSSCWAAMCRYVAGMLGNDEIRGAEQASRKQVTPKVLYLRHRPGVSTDETGLWRAQLDTFIQANKADDRQPLLVVAVRADKHHRVIYDQLKTICDSKPIDAQTFFVNMASVDEKSRQFPQDGFAKVGNELLRRMRIRNPPPPIASPLEAAGENFNTAVALHVSRIVAVVPEIGRSGQAGKARTLYMAALVSRDFESASRYKTTTHLLTVADMQGFDPTKFVRAHLDHWDEKPESEGHERKVTVLRTGYFPALGGTELRLQQRNLQRNSNESSKELPCAERINGSPTGSSWLPSDPTAIRTAEAFTVAIDEAGRLPTETKTKVIEREADLLHGGLSKDFKQKYDFTFSYVLLEQGEPFHYTKNAKSNISADVGKQGGAQATLFIRDTKLANSQTNQIHAHRKVTAKNDTKLISMTLVGDRLVAGGMEEEIQTDPVELAKEQQADLVKRMRSTRLGKGFPASAARKPSHVQQESSRGPSESPEQGGNYVPSKLKPMFGFDGASDDPPGTTFAASPTEDLSYTIDEKGMRRKWTARSEYEPSDPATPRYSGDFLSPDFASRRPSTNRQFSAASFPAAKPGPVAEQTDISNGEIVLLSKLFYDDHLQLYGTRWPCLTHMAHRLTKREWSRLRDDRWDKGGELAPFHLPEVGCNVGRSLYFL
ncbi:hypothetical protein B0A50_06797 [Salinomyces thailandicus]|uniref:Uncharacterized protein n=1 Tax=Salinomyces thailandicus TaxID=706561 RepID=A0A4U0TQM5_9PEZI|nr:hypothetical protein B0A50_06797 [Salinomyces thailandica]